jgi:RHS repeat-associated protein
MNPNRSLSNFQGAVYQYTYNAKKASGVCLQNVTDYSPFGAALDGRTIQGDGYRYGYQGSEKDNESKGGGNSYTTFYRQLDPRVGRWFSIDPLMAKFPWQSPYCAMDNNPICLVDPQGDVAGGPGDGFPPLQTIVLSNGQEVIDIFPKEAYVDFAIDNGGHTDFYKWFFDPAKTKTINIVVHHGNANLKENNGAVAKYDSGGKLGGHVMINFPLDGIFGFTGAGVKDDYNNDGVVDPNEVKEVPLFPTKNPASPSDWYSTIHDYKHYGSYSEIMKGNIKNGGLTTVFDINISRKQYYQMLSFFSSNVGSDPYPYSFLKGERCASAVEKQLKEAGVTNGNHSISPASFYNYLSKSNIVSSSKLIVSDNVKNGSFNLNKIFLGSGKTKQKNLEQINKIKQ